MTGSYVALLAVGVLFAAIAMTALWIVQVRTGKASHVDAGWAIEIALVAVLYAILADGDATHRVLAALLASIWGWRLGLYLLFDRVLGKEEDGRYQSLRARWGTRANRNFFYFFQFQAALVVFFSVPYLLTSLDPSSGLGALEWIGVALWALGNAGAIAADRQLAVWRADPSNRGGTARIGLWGWSRHPNYFFEWVSWCGVAVVATAAPWGWLAWIIPAGLLFLLFRVTGIPATEAQALRGRTDYAEYQRATSVFVPLPRRSRRHEGVTDRDSGVETL